MKMSAGVEEIDRSGKKRTGIAFFFVFLSVFF
jgi:hypothetical protein